MNSDELISNKLLHILVKNKHDTLFAEQVMIDIKKAMEELSISFRYKKNQIAVFSEHCIYCQKTSKESGRALFMIKASGMYYQCYPELCPENKEKWLPDNTKQKED